MGITGFTWEYVGYVGTWKVHFRYIRVFENKFQIHGNVLLKFENIKERIRAVVYTITNVFKETVREFLVLSCCCFFLNQ